MPYPLTRRHLRGTTGLGTLLMLGATLSRAAAQETRLVVAVGQ